MGYAGRFSSLPEEGDVTSGAFPCGEEPVRLQASDVKSRKINSNTNVRVFFIIVRLPG
jgi:hypothetical protein